MNQHERDRTIALAGVFQAAVLAQQLARRGYADEIPFDVSVRSILIIDAIDTPSVFGGISGVRLGLDSMREKLSSANKALDFEVARYVLSLGQLGLRLKNNLPMMQDVASQIAEVGANVNSKNGEGVGVEDYAGFAEIYRSTISHLKPKIIVQGEHGHLSNELIIDKVRTILLAGVRAGFLWGQLGGKRWHLIFGRRRHLANANSILARSNSEDE